MDRVPSLTEAIDSVSKAARVEDSPWSCRTGARSSGSRRDTASASSWTQLSSRSSFADLIQEKANMSTDDEPNPTSEEVQSSLKRWQSKSSSPLSKVHTNPELLRPLTDKAEEGKRLDWTQIARLIRRPMWVFNRRNVVDVAKLERLGFYVESIGKPDVSSRMN